MNGPRPAPADVMDRLAYWHDLRDELPAEAVSAARSYLIGYLAAEVDTEVWAKAVDQAVELAAAEVETHDPGLPWTALAAACLTGVGALGLVELLTRVVAALPVGVVA